MKIYASLDDHIGEGFVWLQRSGLPARCVVKITNPEAKRAVFCEALQFEENFLKRYNQSPRYTIKDPGSSIVMSAWYRFHLGGLHTQRDYSLEIAAADSWYGKIRACVHHPQILVRVAVWLGLVSVALGAFGVILIIASSACGRGVVLREEIEGTAQYRSGADRWLAFARRGCSPQRWTDKARCRRRTSNYRYRRWNCVT